MTPSLLIEAAAPGKQSAGFAVDRAGLPVTLFAAGLAAGDAATVSLVVGDADVSKSELLLPIVINGKALKLDQKTNLLTISAPGVYWVELNNSGPAMVGLY